MAASDAPPGRPGLWRGPLRELERVQWRVDDGGDPVALLSGFLAEHGLAGEPRTQRGGTGIALLAGATGCARLGGTPTGRSSPVPAVPEIAAVAVRPASAGPPPGPPAGGALVAETAWRASWSEPEHAAAVAQVREAIARGDVYQANVVGHASAEHAGDPRALAARVAALPGAAYGGTLSGAGWAVGCASPEQLVRVSGDRVTTMPIKGTRVVGPGADTELRRSVKDRAEHVMIVDLERNDLSRVAEVGSVRVERLYELVEWSGLWQAVSTVAGTLAPGVTTLDVLRALLPGGSVTGAPKHAACALLAGLEPVGRGPAMGALGFLAPGHVELGLTIRTVAADEERVHLWAGGGITWGSDPDDEVAEARAKAAPVRRVLAGQGRLSP